jgi:predicted transcriptional regulator
MYRQQRQILPMPKTLDLRERRERLGLSRERLARLADVSSASIELFEGGWRPQRSRVLPAVCAALARAEAERALALAFDVTVKDIEGRA